MSLYDSINLNGKFLRPSPFVSTSYEYNKYGEYVIGGFLIVTLSGTLIGEDVIAQMNEISLLQTNTDCVTLTIGCSGGSDFLNGAGRIRSVDVSPGDQPYLMNYSIQVAIETIGGSPAVEPDPQFLKQNCLTDVQFLQSYSESISVQADGSSLGANDSALGVSKSYVKASGQISVSSFGRNVCGIPSFNGIDNSIKLLKQRADALLSLNLCGSNSPLASFSGWNKWLDSKNLSIDTGTGTVTWSFDLYMSRGSCAPYAWVDITTEDKQNQKKKTRSRSISGTIRGLSSVTADFIGNKACTNERESNAQRAFGALSSFILNGTWPGDAVSLTGLIGNCISNGTSACPPNPSAYCYQRLSSTISRSPVTGEITFSAEFGDISSCKPIDGIGTIEVTVDKTNPVKNYKEIITPNGVNAIVQDLGAETPARLTVTARGTLNSCDKTKLDKLIECVEKELAKKTSDANGWILLRNKKSVGTYSYSVSKEFIRCS